MTAAIEPELRLLQAFPALLWRSRPEDGLCDWFNDLWLDFRGRTLEEEWGNGWAEGVHPDDFDRCLEIYTTAFGRREAFAMEYRLQRHDGAYRWILDLGRPFENEDGSFGGYLGACYDVHDRRQMVERLQDSQTLTTLVLQTLYHDLRSPFAAMETAAATLSDRQLEPEQRTQLFDVLQHSLDRARGVIDTVRLLEQAASGTLQPRRTPTAVGELLESVAARLDPGGHPIRIVDDIGTADIDPIIIDRALENLLNNAIIHTPRETPIEVRASASNGDLRFVVRDQGPGIDRTVLEQALDPRPAPSDHPTGGSGYGLGLSLAHRYTIAHGGTLEIDAATGRGTAITMVVPAGADADT